MKKRKKLKPEPVDGLSPKDIQKLRNACRQVWYWSHPKRLCVKRAALPNDFFKCEKCLKRVPKIHVDHKLAVGELDGGFFTRLFCPSTQLQALCKKCHQAKTNEERKALRQSSKNNTRPTKQKRVKAVIGDFY